MFCNKCGTKNPETSEYCSKCGEKLNTSPEAQASAEKPEKRKTGLLAGLIAGGVVVIAAAVVLILVFTGAARPVTGDWYSKELSETMAFYADGMVLVANENGEIKGSYKYDERSGQGVINVNNIDFQFLVEGDVLTFSGDATFRFIRFDGGATIAGVIPTPPPPDTSTGAVQPSAETPSGAVMTDEPSPVSTPTLAPAAPTPHPTHHAAPTPEPTPSTTLGTPPTPPPTPTSSFMIFLPVIIDYSDVLGNWGFSALGFDVTLTFNGDNTFNMSGAVSGTYYYDPSTLSGTITSSSGTTHFTLSADKQTLTFEDGATYHRY